MRKQSVIHRLKITPIWLLHSKIPIMKNLKCKQLCKKHVMNFKQVNSQTNILITISNKACQTASCSNVNRPLKVDRALACNE